MKRLKVVLPAGEKGAKTLYGVSARLFDADTGDELECAGDIVLRFPMDGVAIANVDMQIAEIEVK
jgi:hypothetical protein